MSKESILRDLEEYMDAHEHDDFFELPSISALEEYRVYSMYQFDDPIEAYINMLAYGVKYKGKDVLVLIGDEFIGTKPLKEEEC